MTRFLVLLLAPLAIAPLAIAPLAASAQTAVPLPEALALAREQSLAVLRAEAEVDSREAALGAVRASRMPRLGVYASGGQRYGLAFDQTTGALTQEAVEALDLGLDADVTLFDGSEGRARERAAEASVEAARLDRERAALVAQGDVLRAFLAHARAEADRTIAAAQVEAERQLLATVEAQAEWGDRPASEVAQQRERVAAAEGAALDAGRARARAEARLVRLLGLDPSAGYAFPPPPPDDGAAVPGAAALVAVALGARADLKAAQAAVRAARAERRAARAGRLPTVALYGSAGTGYTSANRSTDLPGQFGDNRAGRLGLRVSVPVFDRGTTRAAVRQAEARTAALQAVSDDARRAVALDVREALLDVEASRAQAALAAVRVEAAESALAAEEARYAGGASTLQAVAQLRSRLVEARQSLAQARLAATFGRALLDIAVGPAGG